MIKKTFVITTVMFCIALMLIACSSGDNNKDNENSINTITNNINEEDISETENNDGIENVWVDEPKVDNLNLIPRETKLNGFTFYIKKAFLWRDFMPISPPDGKPLAVVVEVEAKDKESFPKHFEANQLWIFNGDEKWEATVSDVKAAESNSIELSAGGGPKWKIGAKVDVVIKIEDKKSKEYILIRIPDQEIQKTN